VIQFLTPKAPKSWRFRSKNKRGIKPAALLAITVSPERRHLEIRRNASSTFWQDLF
jgi:hypothetical protein